jgi:hypothetical protein
LDRCRCTLACTDARTRHYLLLLRGRHLDLRGFRGVVAALPSRERVFDLVQIIGPLLGLPLRLPGLLPTLLQEHPALLADQSALIRG